MKSEKGRNGKENFMPRDPVRTTRKVRRSLVTAKSTVPLDLLFRNVGFAQILVEKTLFGNIPLATEAFDFARHFAWKRFSKQNLSWNS
jgi:hypothetical protein